MKKTEYQEAVSKLAYYEQMAASIGDISNSLEVPMPKPMFVTLSIGKHKLLHFTFADTDSMSEKGLLDTLHAHFSAQIDYYRRLVSIMQSDEPKDHLQRPAIIGAAHNHPGYIKD